MRGANSRGPYAEPSTTIVGRAYSRIIWAIEIFESAEFAQVCFLYFQAEDGIRELTVTGVQTCALPICRAVPGVTPLLRKRRLGTALPVPSRSLPPRDVSHDRAIAGPGAKLLERSHRDACWGTDRKSVV